MPDFKILFAIFAFIFGAVFASFAGVVAFRMPKGLSIVKPDSYCPSCKRPIKKKDNVPILSWLALGGMFRFFLGSLLVANADSANPKLVFSHSSWRFSADLVLCVHILNTVIHSRTCPYL